MASRQARKVVGRRWYSGGTSSGQQYITVECRGAGVETVGVAVREALRREGRERRRDGCMIWGFAADPVTG